MKILKRLSVFLLLPSVLTAGSLWTSPDNNEQALVGDRRASRVGDILTIEVQENASASSSQRKATDTDGSINAAVGQFLFPPSTSRFGTSGGFLPSMNMGGSSEFSGGGQVNSSQRLTARAAVMVTDVLPNGNLVIAGVRRVTFSGETQHMVLQGIANPSDISSENVLLSEDIAAASLEVISEGKLNEAQGKGWVSRLYERLRPF